MEESPVVYTIGHSNHTAERFLALLREHHIEVVVDIRSVPYSRYCPHFVGESLQLILQEQGIEYVFAGKYLGGRPPDPLYYKSRKMPSGKADYLNIVDYAAVAQATWYQRGLKRLLEIADSARTAIMCSEENPQLCHRHHLIEPTLRERGVTVRHIRGDGTLETIAEEPIDEAVLSPQLVLSGFDA